MTTRVCSIMDIPDEIWIEIILHLTIRERVPLAISCKRLYNLVLEDKMSLRNLDFSKNGSPTSASDIRKYFSDEDRSKHIIRVNLQDIDFTQSRRLLLDHVVKATNLVDINLFGIRPKFSLMSLQALLIPLLHVKRLSIDWPGDIIPTRTVVHDRLSRLTYLSVGLSSCTDQWGFYDILHKCQELIELHVIGGHGYFPEEDEGTPKLRKLEIVKYSGPHVWLMERYFVCNLLSDPEEWTHFGLASSVTSEHGFYLERNVEVCQEMMIATSLERHSYTNNHFFSNLGGVIVPAVLLKQVMRINQQYLPQKFCCFSLPTIDEEDIFIDKDITSVCIGSRMWTLKISQAKRLLKDPTYQISYLDILHDIEHECDVHIVASAFPSLTELVIRNILKKSVPAVCEQPQTTSRSAAPERLDSDSSHPDSCFSKLVQVTPHMKHLTVIADTSEPETWDLTAIHLVAGWKNLTTLHLVNVPINDGEFLIEIGKQCKQLESLELYNLGLTEGVACYKIELLRMLMRCSKLKNFKLRQSNIGELSEIFLLLVNKVQLEKVCVKSHHQKGSAGVDAQLLSSIEELLRRCLKLTTFICLIDGIPDAELDGLTLILQRLKSKLHRPTFQFQVDPDHHLKNIIREDPLALRFF